MALISTAQLETTLGFPVDPAQAQSVIDDVSAIIVDYVNNLDTDPDNPINADAWDETTTPRGVQAVAKQVARRGLVNPDARSSQSLDDHSWQTPMGSAGIYLAPKERRVIRRAAGAAAFKNAELEGYLPLPHETLEDDLVL